MSPARFAQHFLINKEAIRNIIYSLDLTKDDIVLEIGPGAGALTEHLISSAGHVTAIEVDSRMIKLLEGKFSSSSNFHLIHEDILKFDFSSLPTGKQYKVVGNLPYNLTSPILRRLSSWDKWDYSWVMVQKEVGNRMSADVGKKDYGALTVGMNLTCEMKSLFDLSPRDFSPPPRVFSSIVKMKRRSQPLTEDIPGTQRVIQAAFQQRRKTILNSFSHGLGLSKDNVKSILANLNIPETLRAENLSVPQFVQLAQCLGKEL